MSFGRDNSGLALPSKGARLGEPESGPRPWSGLY